MTMLKPLLLAPLALAATILPAIAAPAAMPEKDCMAPAAFLTALDQAGDWIIQRAPARVQDTELKGILFRDSGMINVALFKDGCLAAVMVVGQAPPDIQV
jgi:hypothetical protein